MKVLIVTFELLLMAFLIGVLLYNKIIKIKNTVDEAYSTIDVFLKKRYDLIPNLVDTIKGYASHEKSTLQDVVAARSNAMNSSSQSKELSLQENLNDCIKNVFALSENYPDLKANESFLKLQQQLTEVENDIASARKYYNGCVRLYNIRIQTFPSNIVAKMFKFTNKELFEITNKTERNSIDI